MSIVVARAATDEEKPGTLARINILLSFFAELFAILWILRGSAICVEVGSEDE